MSRFIVGVERSPHRPQMLAGVIKIQHASGFLETVPLHVPNPNPATSATTYTFLGFSQSLPLRFDLYARQPNYSGSPCQATTCLCVMTPRPPAVWPATCSKR